MMKILLLMLLAISLFSATIEKAKKLFDDEKKYKEAIEIFLKYPNDGESQYFLGKAYLYGMGLEINEKKAFEYAKLSALNNNPSGLNLLGVMYEYGNGIAKDELQALMYYKQAANLDDTKAMMNIAHMYQHGIFIKKDFHEALYWYNKAYDKGLLFALAYIGDLYMYDLKDDEKALENYLILEQRNQADAAVFNNIGRIYLKKNRNNDAYDYILKATNLKEYSHTYNLFDLAFKLGLDDKKDEAIEYLKLATDNNNSMATQILSQYYFWDEKKHKEAISILQKTYNQFQDIEAGCTLAMFLNNDIDVEVVPQQLLSTYNPDLSYEIVNKIIGKYPKDKKIPLCYTTLAGHYSSGKYTILDYNKALNIYESILEVYPHQNNNFMKSINDLKQKIKQENEYKTNQSLNNDNKTFPIFNNFIKKEQSVSVLESNKYYFLATNDKSIKIYDKSNLQFIKELRGWIDYSISGIVSQMAYDETNRLLYVSTLDSAIDFTKNDLIKVFDINSGKIVTTIYNKKALKNTFLEISSDGKYLVAINNETLVNIINIQTNEIQFYNLSSQGKFNKTKIEKKDDDYLIHILSTDNELYTFSLKEKRRVKKELFNYQINFRTFNGYHAQNIFRDFESNEIKKLYFDDNKIDIEFSKKSYSFDFKSLMLDTVTTPMQSYMAKDEIDIKYRYGGRLVDIYKSNQLLSTIGLLYVTALNHKIVDNKYIVITTSDVANMLIFTLDGRPIANLQGFSSLQKNIIYNNGYILSYGDDNVINMFDISKIGQIENKKQIHNQETLKGFGKLFGENPIELFANIDDEFISYMMQTKQINFSFTPTVENFKSFLNIMMLEKETIAPRASLYIKNEKDWIIYTPEGLFSYGGEGYKLLKYHQNQGLYKEAKIIENEKLFDKFYRPDLIKKILSGEKVEIPMDVKSVILNIKPPKLSIIENKMINEKDISLTYKVCDEGNGISDSKLIINGQAINPPLSRGFSSIKIDFINDKCKVYKSNHTLDLGENKIIFKAYDKDKNIANESEVLKINANYSVETKPTTQYKSTSNQNRHSYKNSDLYLLTIAVSNYESDALNLKYSVKDASSIKNKFIDQNKAIYHNIHTFNLFDNNVSLSNIEDIFDEIAQKIKYNDTFVLYIAGHGSSENGKYQFLPYKMNEKFTIDDIKNNLSKVAKNKTLVLLDTCESGAALENIDTTATKNRLAYDNAKINFIVASSKNQVALEGYKDHGIFTFSVLDGFENAYNLKEEDLLLYKLGNYVEKNVPEISRKNFKFEQEAQFKMANDFIIGGKKN